MQAGRRKTSAKNGVIAGSVWDSRTKMDEGKGGIKVFNGEDSRKLKRNQSDGVGEKRKTWKSESNEVIERSPIQMRKTKFDSHRFPDKSRKDLSVSVDEIEKNPIQTRKTRSDSNTCKDNQINPSGLSSVCQVESPSLEVDNDGVGGDEADEGGEEIEKSQIQLSNTSSDSYTSKENQSNLSGLSNVGQIKSQELVDEDDGDEEDGGEEDEGQENEEEEEIEAEIEKKNFDLEEDSLPEQKIKKVVNEEKLETPIPISSNESNQTTQVQNHPVIDQELTNLPPCSLSEDFEISPETPDKEQKTISSNVLTKPTSCELSEEFDISPETPNKLQKSISSSVSKQIPQVKNHPVIDPELKKPPPSTITEGFEKAPETPKKLHKPISSNVSKQTTQIKNYPVIVQELRKPIQCSGSERFEISPESQNKFKKSISSNVRKQIPQVKNQPVIYPEPRKPPPFSEEFERFPETQSKLQDIVDLVMWKDVPRSAFVFGFGTFILLSSSFTKDLNFSLISAISYMGLLYLAVIFLYKSILCRGFVDSEESEQTHVVGEEEAIWFLELILPYLNEFLLKLKGLFSGDPATTMKLALFLFVFARCGSSITVWKMAKLGFFGAFTVPKVCSSYSTQITAYGKFWIKRFWDAWDSCSHKKAVLAAIFTFVWNLSSVVARIWAAFMLVVAFRYYQQSLLREEFEEGHSEDNGPTLADTLKEKKGS